MVRIGPLSIGILGLAAAALLIPVAGGFLKAGGIAAAQRGGARVAGFVEDPIRGGLTLFFDAIRSAFDFAEEKPEQGCTQRPIFGSCPPNTIEKAQGFITVCCPTEPAPPKREKVQQRSKQEPVRCPNPADPRCDVFLPPYVPPSKTFRECYQTELTDQEFSGLVSAGAPCRDVSQYEYVLGNNNSTSERNGFRNGSVVSPSFIIPTGGFDVSEIASRLGYRDLTTAQASNIRLGQTGLGALTQAYRRGEIGEDVLRSGFRETIR